MGGRRLEAVAGTATRPTTDRVREALFSRLDSRYGVEGSHLLDLFAGTGALGLEALSRGAASIVFVDRAKAATDVVARNLATLGLQAEIHNRSFSTALEALERRGARFDGVFLDPPYEGDLLPDVLDRLVAGGLLMPGAWVSLEVERRQEVALPDPVLRSVHEQTYGDTKLILLERGTPGEP
jgi:16S rRNA (guanine966-N2)-methyltransferase